MVVFRCATDRAFFQFGPRPVFIYDSSDMKTKSPGNIALQPRLRVRVGGDIALGPGKVELLQLVQQTGSITEAAKTMEISYMRAWTLIRTMNRCFRKPLVIATRGGNKGGGGASLTETGQKALALYEQMNARCIEINQPDWRKLQKLLSR
jgi:molybdate transport system regulatory protein